jgi:hypothetical protein
VRPGFYRAHTVTCSHVPKHMYVGAATEARPTLGQVGAGVECMLVGMCPAP